MGRSLVRCALSLLLALGCGAMPPVRALARPSARQTSMAKKQLGAPTWASSVGRLEPRLAAPEGVSAIETLEGELPVRFEVGGTLEVVWPRWRAALARSGVEITMLDERPDTIVAHLDVEGDARGYVSLGASGGRLRGVLGWVPRPSAMTFASACVSPPQHDVHVSVRSREANPRRRDEEPADVLWGFRTQRMLDVDDDGRLDMVVPIVEAGDCPHEVEHEIYVMRGACGHLVARTLGSPQIAGRARPGGLRNLRTERRWAEITDRSRPPGPHNVATLHEVTTPYVARAGAYRAGTPITRSGICHHCGMSTCRIVSAR